MSAAHIMRTRLLVALSCLLALAAGSALWFVGDGDAAPPPGGAATATDAAVRGAAAGVLAPDGDGSGAGPLADPQADQDEDGTGAAERTALDLAARPLRTGPRVLVVRSDGSTPVPHAVVAWLERSAAEQKVGPRRELLAVPLAFDLPHRHGRTLTADALGVVELPPLTGAVLVACRDEARGEFAAAEVGPRNREQRLVLVADETIRVVVRSAAAPAGDVAVQLYQLGGDGGGPICEGRTTADGTFQVAHFQLYRKPHRDGERFVAALAVPLPLPVTALFEGRPAQRDPIELLLPPTRPLALRLVHRSGAPILAPLLLQLRTAAAPGNAPPRDPAQRPAAPITPKPLGDAPAELPHVGVGAVITALLLVPDRREPVRIGTFAVAAPATAGEPFGPELALPEPMVVMAGRLLDAAGEPLALATPRLALTTIDGRGRPQQLAARLAALRDGRFDFVLAAPPAGEARLRLLLGEPEADAPLGANVALGALQPGERRVVGDIVLRPLPALVRGTVRDDRGQPVAGAQIRLRHFVPDDRAGAWRELLLLRASSGEDGAYAVHGPPPEVPFRVHAEQDGHRTAVSSTVTAGAEVDLRLDRLGVLRGRILLPEFVAGGAATVELRRPAAERPEHSESLRHRSGEFALRGLDPGLYELAVRLRNLPDPLFELAGVRIDPGMNRDPRLALVDLRASLFRYRLRAVGPAGPMAQLEAPLLLRSSGPDGKPRNIGFRWQKGRAEILSPLQFLELWTVGPGLPPVQVAVAPGEHDVYLAPVQPVVLELPGLRSVAGLQRAVRVSLIRKDGGPLPESLSGIDQRSGESFSFPRWSLGRSGGGWLDAFDRAECAVSQNGSYDVVLRFGENENRNSRQVSLPIGSVDLVVDGPLPQQCRLPVDLQQVAALLLQLAPAQRNAPRPDQRPGQRR